MIWIMKKTIFMMAAVALVSIGCAKENIEDKTQQTEQKVITFSAGDESVKSVLDGKSVKLGDWGSFQVRLSTEGADTKEALTAGNVKQVRINFQPGSEMKAALQKATFVWGESFVKGSSTSGGGSSDSGSTDSGNGGGTGSNPL